MRLNDIELEVLVKNRPILEYAHQGHVFIEGRAGSEYEIEVRNVTGRRVEAVISVDGLSVIDGKQAGPLGTGYVIQAYQTLRIPGWMLNNQTAAKFAFAGKAHSYATQTSGDSRNNGVIGVMVFREKPPVSQPIFNYNTMAGLNFQPGWRGMNINDMQIGTATSTSSTPYVATSMSMNATSQSAETLSATPAVPSAQSLGTAFGDSTTFATTTVAFQRGEHHCTLLMYYDERRGLKSRGIRIGRSSKPTQSQPQAFPAMGCAPPPGWTG